MVVSETDVAGFKGIHIEASLTTVGVEGVELRETFSQCLMDRNRVADRLAVEEPLLNEQLFTFAIEIHNVGGLGDCGGTHA